MKKIFITDFSRDKYKIREVFPLVRPFFNPNTDKWEINKETLVKLSILAVNIELSSSAADADIVLISEPLNHNCDENKYNEMAEINQVCSNKNIFAYVFVSGDYGKVHPKFSNIIYYRLGGFRSQLDKNNRALFFLLGDHFKRLFNRDQIVIRQKEEKPTVGFCGHASASIPKYLYEKSKLAQVNLQRLSIGDFNFEPLFSSAFERLNILKSISRSKHIKTNFICRKRYRAGAVTEQEMRKTTLEHYINIDESDYVVCLRGSGNFSLRFYETLMMGRIPIFVNTDCLLPLEHEINWKENMVWVEWKDRKRIADIILDFHKNLTNEQFGQIQLDNREIWRSKLCVKKYIENIINSSG